MTKVLLVYPYFGRRRDRSRFRFPPLGPAYVAAALRRAGHEIELLDCTFLDREQALAAARASVAPVVGVYAMATLTPEAQWFAERLRNHCDLLVAGGPLPTCEPERFLSAFDLVVRGEGEQTMVELVAAFEAGADPGAVPGVVRGSGGRGATAPLAHDDAAAHDAHEAHDAPPRPFTDDLDGLAFPARDLLRNDAYIAFGRRAYGYAITTVMSTRGCPFDCEFCSNVVFGQSYRERSPGNVLDEVEEALALGYDRISFADDVFTLRRSRVPAICDEIATRGLRFRWECLGRVDAFDDELARALRAAGCFRIFFGIESGSDATLALMNKRITATQARDAVEAAHRAGLEVGAFFIVYYPGESDDDALETLRFATRLPLDYLGLTMPYPLPGTALTARLSGRRVSEWRQDGSGLLAHRLTFAADVSETKMRVALLKGRAQFEMRRRLRRAAPLALGVFEPATDRLLRRLR